MKTRREVKRRDSTDFVKIVNPKKAKFQFDNACLVSVIKKVSSISYRLKKIFSEKSMLLNYKTFKEKEV